MKVSSLPILTFLPASLATTIYLAGDSTMASGGGGSDTAGWGDYVAQYLSSSSGITVSNQAVAGRSARSYTREGRFDDIASTLEAGDYVIIEFGHNDGGTLSSTSDNGRTDCSGTGSEVCYSEYDGVNETILTFPAYIENASNTFKKIGATVIISSQTPNNPWETGTFVNDPPRFVGYAEIAAETADTSYVNHFDYTDQVYEALGADTVDAYFPIDHTHTSAAGANVVAKAFLRGVVCGKLSLADELVTDDLELDEYECLDE